MEKNDHYRKDRGSKINGGFSAECLKKGRGREVLL
jgi:hypothetical protein